MPDHRIHIPLRAEAGLDRGREVARLAADLPRSVREKLLAFLHMTGDNPDSVEASLEVSDTGSVALTVSLRDPERPAGPAG